MAKIFLITGASRGIGLGLARVLAEKGHTVIAAARNPEKSEGLKALGDVNVHRVTLDITNKETIKAAVEQVERFAPQGIDVLINNSAIMDSGYTAENMPGEEYSRIFETNVVGTSNVTQAFLPLLRKANTRHILNISSTAGSLRLTSNTSFSAYRVSKAGLNMLTKLFSIQLRHEGFVVLAVHPGWVKTDMGGQDASISIDQSVNGIANVAANITSKDNGTYVSNEGKIIPW
ncbi:NAD(P)-binding protein [Phycomyces nitens]|nr:NAD(P)-binding protein [Phycomyces nitens]